MSTVKPPDIDLGQYKFGWHDPANYVFEPKRGLNADVVREISFLKGEPEWMLKFRLRALEIFERKPMPTWGGDLDEIDFQNIFYFIRSSEKQSTDWNDVPTDIKNTFDRLGIPEAEQKYLSGVSAQYESEVVYHSLREDLEAKGVIFCDTDTALREHEDLFREHWATVIPPGDNKLAALNSAVWSGGSFIWVPPDVHVEIPLQAYFRINAENMGQFERTLIICEPGSFVHYVEGCTAPVYTSDSLHSAVVEIIVKPGARCRYTTIQNWSTNVFNLVTKRAVAQENATMEWVDGNLGSKLTMKYPAVWLTGRGAHGEVLSVAMASEGMHQDAGRQDGPRRPRHVVHDRLQVDLARRRAHQLPRPRAGAAGRQALEGVGGVRRAAARRRQPLGHVPVHGHPGGGLLHRPRGHGVQDRRRPDLLPHEPWALRGGGHGDDRARLHRADRQGAADGVRRRAQPADRASDGGLDWLSCRAGRPRSARPRPSRSPPCPS